MRKWREKQVKMCPYFCVWLVTSHSHYHRYFRNELWLLPPRRWWRSTKLFAIWNGTWCLNQRCLWEQWASQLIHWMYSNYVDHIVCMKFEWSIYRIWPMNKCVRNWIILWRMEFHWDIDKITHNNSYIGRPCLTIHHCPVSACFRCALFSVFFLLCTKTNSGQMKYHTLCNCNRTIHRILPFTS